MIEVIINTDVATLAESSLFSSKAT